MTDCDRTATALRDYYLRAHRVIDRRMTAQGNSFARHKLLMTVSRQDSLRVTDIADQLGQAPRTITEGIDGLERDGLVRRDPDPADRRAKRVSLTDAGRTVVAASEPERERFLVDLFGALSGEERDQLVMLIGKLNDRLQQMEAEA